MIETRDTGEAQERGHDNSEVTATISADYAEGHESKLDAALNLLAAPRLELTLPTHGLDDSPHIIAPASSSSNRALQDYQMQLMLLEQQNKKKLPMARQERPGTQASIREPFERVSRELVVSSTTSRPHDKAIENSQNEDSSPTTLKSDGAEDKASSQLYEWDAMAIQSSFNITTVDTGDAARNSEDEFYKSLLPHLRVVYQVNCAHRTDDSHMFMTFKDLPKVRQRTGKRNRKSSAKLHLNGEIPILDLEDFMNDEKSGNDFVVMRHIRCSEASVLMAIAGNQLQWTQSIYARSKIAMSVMQRISTCYFNAVGYEEKSLYRNEYPHMMHGQQTNPSYKQREIQHEDLFFFHHHAALKAFDTTDYQLEAAAKALLKYVDHNYEHDFSEMSTLTSRGKVDSNHVLKLYKPNELLVSGTVGQPAVFVLQCWPRKDSRGFVELTCWYFHTDGTGFARRASRLEIPPLTRDVTDIRTLTVFPLQFADLQTQEYLLKRGKKHWNLRIPTQIAYKGWTSSREQYFSDARFMVDNTIYHKMHRNSIAFAYARPEETYPFDNMPAYVNVDQDPSDTILLLLPPALHGFYFHEKKWLSLLVDNVHPVVWNKKAFERLVLPSKTKALIRALIGVRTTENHPQGSFGVAGKRTDITGGKGSGLIMLLHGGPGTGKTLTGESVAEMAEMPLYRVTCGDIGTNAEDVEKYLNTVLHLGKCWNCVLLLDEADIFLEERANSDLERNSLVSVFLRILEYYDGILILTSNRVGLFDEAFKSRIQVALYYENLNRSSRKAIWRNFLEMLEEDEEDVNFDELRLRIDDLASKELNGRQIRNALTTARQLALYQKERLDWEHLEQALAVAANFNAYLQRMQGHTDDERARDIKLR